MVPISLTRVRRVESTARTVPAFVPNYPLSRLTCTRSLWLDLRVMQRLVSSLRTKQFPAPLGDRS
jgi:hypothetical protein